MEEAASGAVYPDMFLPVLKSEGQTCSRGGSFTMYLIMMQLKSSK
jgi:hypothetical protein